MSSLVSSVTIWEVEDTAIMGVGEKCTPLKLCMSDFNGRPTTYPSCPTYIKFPENGLGVMEMCIEDRHDEGNNRRFRIAKADLIDLVKAWM